MKFYFGENVYGWKMYGIVGKGAKWFVGYSKVAQQEVS